MTKVLLCENPTRMRPFFTFRRTYRKLTRTLRSTNYSPLKAKLTLSVVRWVWMSPLKRSLLQKIVSSLKPLSIFAKNFILDIWLGSELFSYPSVWEVRRSKRTLSISILLYTGKCCIYEIWQSSFKKEHGQIFAAIFFDDSIFLLLTFITH